MASAPRLGERRRSFAALYEHWERHQWSPLAIDFSVDAVTFAGLDRETRERLVWVYAHRFHAEFNVAELLAPFLLAAPDYDIRLLLATQVADEYRHVESVLRVYSEVFGVKGGIEEVKALADSQFDAVAAALYDALDGVVRALDTNREEDTFLRAVIAYHWMETLTRARPPDGVENAGGVCRGSAKGRRPSLTRLRVRRWRTSRPSRRACLSPSTGRRSPGADVVPVEPVHV